LVRFNVGSPQKTVIELDMTDRVTCGSYPFQIDGPDLAFLLLPNLIVGSLKARSSFLNLSKRREEAMAGKKPGLTGFDLVVGIIGERTSSGIDERREARFTNIEAIPEFGEAGETREAHGMDLVDFTPKLSEGYVPPGSYKGMSGGGWWRIFCQLDNNSRATVVEKRVLGVAFHETDVADGSRTIVCHGPKSVYKVLIDAVEKKWPHEFA
jgi:hypothetical protein